MVEVRWPAGHTTTERADRLALRSDAQPALAGRKRGPSMSTMRTRMAGGTGPAKPAAPVPAPEPKPAVRGVVADAIQRSAATNPNHDHPNNEVRIPFAAVRAALVKAGVTDRTAQDEAILDATHRDPASRDKIRLDAPLGHSRGTADERADEIKGMGNSAFGALTVRPKDFDHWTGQPAAPAPAPEPKAAKPAAADPPPVGKVVRFQMPHATSPTGKMNAAGTVLRHLPDGRVEVKLQQGGYVNLNPSDIDGPKAATPAKPPANDAAGVADVVR